MSRSFTAALLIWIALVALVSADDTWQPLVSVQPAAAESGKSTLSIDRTSSPNVLYAVYDHSASSTNLFYRTSPVTTISWGTEVTIPYPMIADIDMKVAQAYGMIHPGASATATCARYSSSTPSVSSAHWCTTR